MYIVYIVEQVFKYGKSYDLVKYLNFTQLIFLKIFSKIMNSTSKPVTYIFFFFLEYLTFIMNT